MTPIDTPTTAALLRALAHTDEERARVELIIAETRRAAEVSARIDREQVAELGRGRCPASSGFICTGRQKPKKCTGCGKKTATLLCDFPVEAGKTCDKSICKACSRHVGPDRDYCMSHPASSPGVLA